jgi:hypothetical protein
MNLGIDPVWVPVALEVLQRALRAPRIETPSAPRNATVTRTA